MFLRLLGCSLLLAGIFAWVPNSVQFAAQTKDNAAGITKWEYKTVRIPGQCSSENDMNAVLNDYGRLGWEMVNFERIVPAPEFPNESQGSLLIRPSATGAGAAVSPQTADSFEGTITMKMVPVQTSRQEVCRAYFKRAIVEQPNAPANQPGLRRP
jgi:hypothetical protein